MIKENKENIRGCLSIPEKVLRSAEDFGPGKCYIEATFVLIASDNNSPLDHDHLVISAEELKKIIEKRP
jgi:hypothetical protein